MSREYFDRNKIVNGLMKACQKRPVSRKQIEQIANEVERHISNEMLTEVNTDKIGQIIMKNLKRQMKYPMLGLRLYIDSLKILIPLWKRLKI